MSLLDEARAQSLRPGPMCHVQKALKAHPALAEQIGELIRARDVENSTTERIFNAREIRIKRDTVSRHRKNECDCCKDLGITW